MFGNAHIGDKGIKKGKGMITKKTRSGYQTGSEKEVLVRYLLICVVVTHMFTL